MATKYKYDKDTDYAALMEQAARRGDNAAAAVYEQQRNAKIRDEGMAGQEQTSDYVQYLPIEDVPDYDDAHRREAEALLTGRGTADRREQIDRMLDALLGEQFDYDPASDKLYAAYRQQYERQAELAAENALELSFYVFSASCALHESRIASEIYFCKILIQNLSKMDFRDKHLFDNYLNFIIIYLLILVICDRESIRITSICKMQSTEITR